MAKIYYLFSAIVSLNAAVQYYVFIRQAKPFSLFMTLWLLCSGYYFWYHATLKEGLIFNYPYLYGSLIIASSLVVVFIYYTFFFLINRDSRLKEFRWVSLLPAMIIALMVYYQNIESAQKVEEFLAYSYNMNFPEYYHESRVLALEYLCIGTSFILLMNLLRKRVNVNAIFQEWKNCHVIRDGAILLVSICIIYMTIWALIYSLGLSGRDYRDILEYLYLGSFMELVIGLIVIQVFSVLVKHRVLRFNYNTKNQNEQNLTNQDLKLKQRIEDLMLNKKAYLDPELDIKKFSDNSGLHYKVISGYFNKVAGIRFDEMINECRIKEAVRLLKKKEDLNVIQIAFDSGFDSAATFYRQFRKIMKCTPVEYRSKIER